MNKRILSILLGLVLVASLLVMAVPVNASTSTEVKLLPDKTEANPGDTITYTLSLGPCDEVGGFEFRYIFPEGLEYVPGSGKVVSGAKEAMHFGTLDWTQKSMLLNGTTALESEEYYDYKSDSDTALMTFDVKVADDASGDLTVTFKEGYPNTWIQNWTTEKTHDLTYTTQAVTIGGSAEPTEAPAEPTEAPAEPTEAPAEPTEAPVVEPTIDPAAPTEAATEAAGQDATVAPTQAATSAATKDTATKTTTSPKTGDATHMTLWMFIMIASLVGVAVVLYAAKRKGIFTK